MGELAERLGQVRERWTNIAPKTRLIGLTAVGVIGAAIALFVAGNQTSNDSVLFANLSPEDGAMIVERLKEMHVPYDLTEGGTAVMVPEEHVHESRLTLAAEGLPNGGGVGFEIFDEQRFGESEFAEQVKYHRALEGELSRTIGHLSGVENARVHLVLPQRSLFTSTQQHATASVALRLAPGWQMGDDRVRGIVHLVASSVRGLDPLHVTVVDGQGRRMSGTESGQEELASDALAYRRQIEEAKEQAVQQMLDTTLGAGASIVRVAADVNFTREERTEEIYDPEAVAPRSFQIDEERDSRASASAGGVPGTVSNLPGGAAPSASGTSRDGMVRRSETRNFEISKTVRRAIEPVGRVERLQVAVMVDGTWTGEGEARAFEPRPAEDLQRIQTIVASAVGLNTERGDQVTVECVPFAASENPVADMPEAPTDPIAPYIDTYEPYFKYVGGLLGALFVLLLLLRVRRALKNAAKRAADAPHALPTPVTVRELEEGVKNAAGDAATVAATLEEGARDEARLLAAELAEQDPEMAARVVRGWLTEGRT